MYQGFWWGGFHFIFFVTVICAYGSYFAQIWDRQVHFIFLPTPVVPRFFSVKCVRSREFSHPTAEAFDLGCTFLYCGCREPSQGRGLWVPRWDVQRFVPGVLSFWVQPMPSWLLVFNIKWMASHGPQPILREPELFGFLTLCSFQGRNGGGGAVKPNNPPSLCQPLGDKENQSSLILRSVHICKLLL